MCSAKSVRRAERIRQAGLAEMDVRRGVGGRKSETGARCDFDATVIIPKQKPNQNRSCVLDDGPEKSSVFAT